MTTRDALLEAMRLPADSDTARWMQERGIALADEETLSQALHAVYCGTAADHAHPTEKDHAQALLIIAALHGAAPGGARS